MKNLFKKIGALLVAAVMVLSMCTAAFAAVKEATIAYAKLAKDVEWQSLDEKPVQLVIMLAIPETQGDVHLKILSELAMKLMDEELVEDLKSETDSNKIIEFFSSNLLNLAALVAPPATPPIINIFIFCHLISLQNYPNKIG